MRKSLSTSLSDSLSTARVFGIPLEEVQHSGQPGHEVPLLVRSIVEYIEEHGGLHLSLFLVNGNAERVEWLRQRYDSGVEVNLEKEADLASAVSLLRLFLQELPEPIIPAGLQAQIMQLYQDYSSEEELGRNMKYFLQQLPQVNYSLLRFLCRFLSGVASLQEESWSIGALAAVFGPDVFHLDTDVEDLKEQESVSRILAELLENQEEFFDSEEDDDISNTNDYSSINDQITELLEEEKLEACEELPRDGEDGPSSLSPKHAHVAPSSSSHISSINILPGSADIIQRTIRAAVEQHLLDLQTSIDKELGSYESQVLDSQPIQGNSPTQKTPGPENHEDVQSESEAEIETIPEATEESLPSENSEESPGSQLSSPVMEESSGMDLDTKTLIDAENLTIERRENYPNYEQMDQADVITCEPGDCDLNANTESTEPVSGPQSLTRSVFSDSEQEDPVPVFMPWQEEAESGEAQLSPLAGRMMPLPLEEDAQPLLARRFLDFGHSQRFFQQDHDATSSTKTLSCGRPRRASLTSKDSLKGDTVSHQLTKKLQNLKKKIKHFEEQFEKERNYKPSHADKAADPKVLKWMTDLTKIRKQLKGRQHLFPKGSLRHQAVLQSYRCHSSSSSVPNTPHFTLSRPLNASRQAPHFYAKHKAESELTPQTRPRSNTLPKSFGSTLDQSAHEGPVESEAREHRPTREESLELIQRCIQTKRDEDGWPEDVRKMTKEQLASEKTVMQKNLLFYEGLHGRPVTREERLIVKPLYDRYRLVKQMLTRVSITPIIASPSSKRRNQMLQPIIEGETAHFCGEIEEEEEEEGRGQQENVEMQSESSEIIMDPVAQPSSQLPTQEDVLNSGKLNLDLRLSSSNASSMPELLEQLWKARAEKKKLRRTIREFEDEFYQQNGRNAQKEDRMPMMDEYKEYKRIKAKLRLLEVLISKQDSSKSI
ncbi:protein FAM13B isoform X3 [Rhinichthys klamathensis goyatoka]|uniref:protein FAM13B isoform X3 n=1 Tax=Rhinichthys klamathensis goyatoka TaxID=3034132 RepID=UPI0024B4EB4A|nr:protein FAM13B isoform X3 [Rhinichthys klamathensis goyatoka]